RDLDAGFVRDPGRGEDDRLVARVQDCLACLVDRVLGPAGNNHLLRGAGELVLPGDLPGNGARQLRDAVARGVMRLPPLQRIDACVRNMLWSSEVGFADGEA